MQRSGHRRVVLSFVAAAILHLLGLAAYERWLAGRMVRLLRPVRYAPLVVPRDPFRPVPPSLLEEDYLERLRREAAAPAVMPELAEGLWLLEPTVPPWEEAAVEPGGPHERRRPEALRDTLPALEELELEAVRRRAAELEAYARPWVPDADTADAESQRRRRARQIVLAAVEAMGGMDALLEIGDMRYQGRYHKSYGTWSKYAQYLPGGARVVYDGHRGWVDVHGTVHVLSGTSLREVQKRAARWDFLSRYLGDGVALEYVGSQGTAHVDDLYHVVRVVDEQFGGAPFWAHFDGASGLLVREEFRNEPGPFHNPRLPPGPYLHLNYLDYGPVGRVRLWHTVERHNLWARRYARRASPVSWEAIADAAFAPPRQLHEAAPEAPPGLEPVVAATLWVEVRLANLQAASRPVLPGGPGGLDSHLREQVRKQLAQEVAAQLGRSRLFSKVVVGTGLRLRTDLPAGDYVLLIDVFCVVSIVRGKRVTSPPLYAAALHEASTMEWLMQDGPTGEGYLRRAPPPPCGRYFFSAYTVDSTLAYADPGQVAELVRCTWQKAAASIKAHGAGLQKAALPYRRDCCYCDPP